MFRKLATALLACLALATPSTAQSTYTWNPASTGNNSWDTTTAIWSTNGAAPFNQPFANGTTNNAVLALNTGTADLTAGTAINLGQLRVGSDGFTLTSGSGTNGFTFNQGFQTVGGARTLTLVVGSGATSSFMATGTGDTSAGQLTLNLSSLVGGQGLRVNSGTAFGTSASVVVNSTTGGASGGTRLTLGDGVSTPTGASLTLTSNPTGDVRSTLGSGGGTQTWNGAVSLTGGGVVGFNNTSANGLQVAGGVGSGASATTLQLTGTGTGTVSGVMSGAMNLEKDGSGSWRLTQTDSTFTGTVTIAAGTLRATKLANGGQSSSLGAGTSAVAFGTDGSSNAVLEFTGGAANSTNRELSLRGDAGTAPVYTIRASGESGAALTWAGNVTTAAAAADRTLILDGTNVGNNTVAGTITSSGGTLGLAKLGNGTWVLAGANSYTGTTRVFSGTLAISGNQSAATGSVTVGAGVGTATLGGTGTVGGDVSVANGGVIRGDSGSGTGTLTLAADTTVTAGTTATRGTLATRLTTDGNGAITSNSQLALTGANTDLNFNGLTTGSRFDILLLNDAGLVNGQQYSVTLATAVAGANLQRNGSGTAAFEASDFNLVSSSGRTFESVSLSRSGSSLRLTFTPVPEPAGVLAVVGLAGVGVAGWRRVRRRASAGGVE